MPGVVDLGLFGHCSLLAPYQGYVTRIPPVTALMLLGLGIVYIIARYHIWSFQVLDDAVFLKRGVAVRERSYVLHVPIQHFDTKRGPLERLLGLSRLVIFTAGTRESDVTIPGLRLKCARERQQKFRSMMSRGEHRDEGAV